MTEWITTAARPHPMRLRLDSYPVRDKIAARYADVDSNAHLNNLALEALHENARATMNRELMPAVYRTGKQRLLPVTAHSSVHFLAEAHWPALIATGAGVGRIGRTSYVLSTGLFIGDACIGVCDTVLVPLRDGAPVEVPADFRAALETALLRPDSP